MIMGKEELDRIKELQHNEELLHNCIDYLVELWEINNDKEEIKEEFEDILGFTKEDLNKFGIGGEENE